MLVKKNYQVTREIAIDFTSNHSFYEELLFPLIGGGGGGSSTATVVYAEYVRNYRLRVLIRQRQDWTKTASLFKKALKIHLY